MHCGPQKMIGNQESYVTPVVSGKMSKQKELEVFGFLTLLLKHVIIFFFFFGMLQALSLFSHRNPNQYFQY